LNTPASSSSRGVGSLSQWLGYLGLIPFLVAFARMFTASLTDSGIHSAALLGLYVPYVFITYSAIIMSFLCGILWTKGRRSPESKRSSLSILFSNIIAILAWITLLMINISPLIMLFAVTLLLCGYASLLIAERSIDSHNEDADYWRMRLLLTATVIVIHSMVLVLLIGDL
jgi:hypothetical protein